MINSREIALGVLYETEYNGAYVNLALKEALAKNKELSAKDKGLVTRLVYGCVSRRNTLEYIIEQYSKIKIKKISKYIMLILKLGIYQLIYTDKIPQSAAVNESVKLARRYGHQSSAGFVNGLLHSVIRNGVKYPEEVISHAVYEYSYPEELVKKWFDDFGDEFTYELMQSMNEDPKLTLRVNTLKTSRKELTEKNPLLKPALYYENSVTASGLDVGSSNIYKSGLVTVQDISAMLASAVLNPQPGESVIDLCAAPGGKTTHLAELMQNKGSILACDCHEHKTELIEKNAERLGIDIINTVCMDSSVYKPSLDSRFDKVLADVPCSGWGIIRRKPDIKWKNVNTDELIGLSEKILTNALKYVKIGGEVVFSTCTINPEENEIRFRKLLCGNNNFMPVNISEYLPEDLRKSTTHDGYLTLYPNIDGTDGFFIAKIKRCK